MRYPRSTISRNFPPPTYEFEEGFVENDSIWKADERETKEHVRERARLVFDRIFMLDKETCECLRYFVRYVPGPLTPRWKTFASPRTVELSTDLLAY